MELINTINGIDILLVIIALIIGARFGMSLERAREHERKIAHKEDFIEYLKGETIEAQMRRDGWKL
jgi:hypothetical protein